MEPLTPRENNLLKWVWEREFGPTWSEAFFFERNFPRAIMEHMAPVHAVGVLDDWRTGMVMAIDEVVNELKTRVDLMTADRVIDPKTLALVEAMTAKQVQEFLQHIGKVGMLQPDRHPKGRAERDPAQARGISDGSVELI